MSIEYFNPKDFPYADGLNQTSEFENCMYLSGRIKDGFELRTHDRPRLSDEIIIVDRRKDEKLQELIKQAMQIREKKPDALEAAFYLAQLVHKRMESPNGYSNGSNFTDLRPYESPLHQGRYLIGDISYALRKVGVCRHQSILFQVLAGDVNLNVAMRGGYNYQENTGHMWNELSIDNLTIIIDTREEELQFMTYEEFQIYEGFLVKGHSDASWYDQFDPRKLKWFY